MCLITEQMTPTILTEDLIVYKVLKKHEDEDGNINIKSVYHGDYLYIPGKLNVTDIMQSKDGCAFDFVAQRAYESNLSRDRFGEIIEFHQVVAYGQGFHFATSLKRLEEEKGYLNLYKCTIPAGSEVYHDKTGLGITNQIIVNEEIKRNDPADEYGELGDKY